MADNTNSAARDDLAAARDPVPAPATHGRGAAGSRRRPSTHNPNHHLWRNGRRWWIAFTVHTDDGRRMRVRRSLGTTDVLEARRRRDEVFARAREQSALRLAGLAASLARGSM